MFCGECGTQNPDTNRFCNNCGKPLEQRQPPAAPAQPVAVYQPVPGPAASTMTVPVTTAFPTEKQLKITGIAGFLISLVSLVRYPYICGIIAIILGAAVFYKSENKKSKAAILAVIGIIIGLASIIVDLFFFEIFPPRLD